MAVHLLERGAGIRARREDRGALALLRRFDVVLVACTLAVSALGIVVVYAATRTTGYIAEPTYYLKRQVVFSIVGVVVMCAVAAVDYRRLEQWAYLLYAAVVLALLAVFVIGKSGVTAGTGATATNVAQRWINLGPFQFQPSEFAVLGVIGAMALFMTRHKDGLGPKRVVQLLAMIGIPLLIVVRQSDLGTAIVMFVVALALLLTGGVKVRYLAAVVVLAVLAFLAGASLHLVHASQIQRLTSFLHPNAFLQSANYQPYLARQAIGSGGLAGTGLFHGTFTNLGILPEQSTDFIFATVGEQLGFVGSAVIIGLFAMMSLRILRAAQSAKDSIGRLVCAGVLVFLVFSVFQNIGMNVGLMPVTGIPLPFISYGGSAIIVFYGAVGVVLSVELRRGRAR